MADFEARLREVVRSDHLAVLAGAGISLPSPSRRFAGAAFLDGIIGAVVPPQLDVAWYKSLRDRPANAQSRPGEFLRFETMIGLLQHTGIDPGLTVLDVLDEDAEPNRGHNVLASLMKSGIQVVTPNFDRLIETAWELQGPDGIGLTIAYEPAHFPLSGPASANSPTLWKIHGTISANGVEVRESLQTSLTGVLRADLRAGKREFLRALIRDYDLVVVGYSGSDDFDLMPILSDPTLETDRRIVWVQHVNDGTPVIRTTQEQQRKLPSIGRYNTVGPPTMIHSGRDWANMHFVECHTDRLLDALVAEHLDGVEPVRIDRPATWPSDRYFTDWIAQCNPSSASRFRFAHEASTVRAWRPDGVERRRLTRDDLAKAASCSDLTSLDQIASLEDKASALGQIRRRPRRLLRSIKSLHRELPAELHGRSLRLTGRLLFLSGKVDSAVDYFRSSIESDRRMGAGGEASELTTLLEWLRLDGATQWHDLFPLDDGTEGHSAWFLPDSLAERQAAAGVRGTFGADEHRRIPVLARKTGNFAEVWQLGLQTLESVINEDVPWVLVADRLRRFYVDIGDARSEANAARIQGQVSMMHGYASLAVEHLTDASVIASRVGATAVDEQVQGYLHHLANQAAIPPGRLDELRERKEHELWMAT